MLIIAFFIRQNWFRNSDKTQTLIGQTLEWDCKQKKWTIKRGSK
jgi:hypothetical protein